MSYYSIGALLPDFASTISTNVSSVANESMKNEVKAAFGRGLSPADVKANKSAWPVSDSAVDQIYAEWQGGGSSDSGFSFGDLTSGLTSFLQVAAPVGQAALQYKLQQDQLKQLEKAGRGNTQQALNLRSQLSLQPNYASASASGTPSWVLPVAVVGGLGMFGLLALALLKK